MVDNLPAATRFVRTGAGGGEFTYMDGFPVGVEQMGRLVGPHPTSAVKTRTAVTGLIGL